MIFEYFKTILSKILMSAIDLRKMKNILVIATLIFIYETFMKLRLDYIDII